MECNQSSIIKSLLEVAYDLNPKQDPYQDVIPSLSREDVKGITTYFRDNRITLKEDLELSEGELKTISYLAEFYRKRVAYNPMAINMYLATLGYCGWNDKPVKVVCYKKGMYDTEEGRISFDEWKELSDDEKKEYVTTNDLYVYDIDVALIVHNDLFLRHGKYKFNYPPVPSMFPYIYTGIKAGQYHKFGYVINSKQLDNMPPYTYSGIKATNSIYLPFVRNENTPKSKPPYTYSGIKATNGAYLKNITTPSNSKMPVAYLGVKGRGVSYLKSYKLNK